MLGTLSNYDSDILEYILENVKILVPALIAIIALVIFLAIVISNRHRRAEKKALKRAVEAQSDGLAFEDHCADLLELNGFTNVEQTPASADFGVDIFAEKGGVTYAFQCKYYDHPVGTKAVQEIYSGRDFYHCMVGVVLTNQTFTAGAVKMAEAFNILLWGAEELEALERLEQE